MGMTQLVHARIHHARSGGARNAFTYAADFILAPMHLPPDGGKLYARNRPALFALLDRDHGDGKGDACQWARAFLQFEPKEIWLLTQPRLFGFVFNPVSFWFFLDESRALRAVLAEVNNTEGGRHAYLCERDDGGAIRPADTLTARKEMWVSPFQRASGTYSFRFSWREDQVAVTIAYRDRKGEGMFASIDGARGALTDRALIATVMRRPLGSMGALALIFWQALKLVLSGERYRPSPATELNEDPG